MREYQLARLLKKNGIIFSYDFQRISKIRLSKRNGRPFVFLDLDSVEQSKAVKSLLKKEGIDFIQPIQPLTISVYMDKLPKSGRP